MDNYGYQKDNDEVEDTQSDVRSHPVIVSTDSLPHTEPCYARHCACCVRSLQPPPSPSTPRHKRCLYAFKCPPFGALGDALTFSVMAAFLWGAVWAIIGRDALPGGNIFGIVVLFIGASVGGNAVGMLKPLPPLLGMLLVGFCLRNIPVINVAADIDEHWSASLRTIALVVILIRAGLGLDWQKLKKMQGGALRLSFIPCLVETLTVAIASKFLFSAFLIDFPWDWAFMLGFVHSAVSPAVVVPSMLGLQQKGLGVDKGVPTLLIAAGTLDDVIAISGFSLVLGITFSTEGNLAWDILRAPTEVILGLVYGLGAGFLCTYLPPQQHDSVHSYRFLLLLLCGLFGEFGAKVAHVEGAGALGVLVMAFVAGHGWKVRGTEGQKNPVPAYFATLWHIFQPLLFGLIGAAVDVKDLYGDILAWGSLVLLLALIFRTVATFLAVMGTGLNRRERLFATLAWLPKATVQAAIGSVALDTAKRVGAGADDEERGTIILALSVYVILITAPVGAVLIAVTAKHLLTRSEHIPSDLASPSPSGTQLVSNQGEEHTKL